jgi:proteic killer suppression protein
MEIFIEAAAGTRYVSHMISSFRDKRTAAVWAGRLPKGFPPDLLRATRRKLGYLDAAGTLDDLRSPPGNRLGALSGNRAGQHSIRVNDQWRVCFVWQSGNAEAVEIVDYH